MAKPGGKGEKGGNTPVGTADGAEGTAVPVVVAGGAPPADPPLAPPTPPPTEHRLLNQFLFNDRVAQTSYDQRRDKGVITEPPGTSNASGASSTI